MLACTVSLSSTVSWLTTPMSARSDRRVSRVSGTPSIRIAPSVGSWKRGSRSASGRLPRPARPDQRHHLALGERERHLAQHQVALPVAERDPVEDDLPLEPRLALAGPVHLGARLVQDLEHPFGARQGHRHDRGIGAIVLSGEVSLRAAIRNTMIASGASGAAQADQRRAWCRPR